MQSSENTSASVVIIGMRGSGKTFIGGLAAQSLGWTFLDADHAFEKFHKIGVREFVHEQGWPAFRAAETEMLKTLLEKYPKGYVLSLGGGIIETPAARDVLREYGKTKGSVVEIVREVDEIVKYLTVETERPQYGEPIEDVCKRRQPWFSECSTHQFVNYTGVLQHAGSEAFNENAKESASPTGQNYREEVSRFFHQITGTKLNTATNFTPGKRSYFLSLTYPDITPALPHIDELTIGADAIELRVDLLRAPNDKETRGNYIPPTSYVVEQLASLRQKTTLPVVFTVRTVSQGGSHPDGAEAEAFALFDLAVRMGCEYIDIELVWKDERIREFSKHRGKSQIIASWHDWSGQLKWDGTAVREYYKRAASLGDIVKIVGKALSAEDNLTLRAFVASIEASMDAKPLIAINTGYEGQMSRILNSTFSPITHPLMTVSAAPGQLSFPQIQTALHLVGLLPAKKFYLLGSSISSSPSPTLHNTGFRVLGLPHSYGLFETAEVDESIKALVKSADFGGASVTIPHKLSIIPLMDELTPCAKAIGAVNTVFPVPGPGGVTRLVGDNTDWLGIRNSILARLPVDMSAPEVGLVIGAGGTARAALYAMRSLSVKRILLYNRTRESAEALISAFPDCGIELISSVESFPDGAAPTLIVSTVPGSATALEKTKEGLLLSRAIFSARKGVVVDMAYRPAETPLLSLAKNEAGWASARGVDVLLEQGYEQFVAWAGRRCPRKQVIEKVMEMYNNL